MGQTKLGKLDRLPALLVLLAATVAPASSAPLSSQQIFSKWSRAVVTIQTPTGAGTGFFDSSGLLCTAFHVIDGADRATITFSDGRKGKVECAVGADRSKDCAWLMTDIQVHGPLLGGYAALKPGERLTVIGSPLGFSQTVTEGIVSAKRTEGSVKHLQLSAGVSPGSSGSPVFNTKGEVVGMVVSTRTDGQLLNFALSSAEFARLHLGIGLSDLSSHAAIRAGGKESVLVADDDIRRWFDLDKHHAEGYVGLKAVEVVVEFIPEELKEAVSEDEIRQWLADALVNGGLKVRTPEERGRMAYAQAVTRPHPWNEFNPDFYGSTELGHLKQRDGIRTAIYIALAAVKQPDGTTSYGYLLELHRAGVILPGWITTVTVDEIGGVGHFGSGANAKDVIHRFIKEQAAQIVARYQYANRPH